MDTNKILSIGLIGVVVILTFVVGNEFVTTEFTFSEEDNFSVQSGEWLEKGSWLENESTADITVTDNGYLAIENPAKGDVAVWHSEPFFPNASHYINELYILTNNVQYNDKFHRVTLQYFCLDQEVVFFERKLDNGGQTIPVNLDRDTAYEIRLVLETDEADSPEVEFLNYKYDAISSSGMNMNDLSIFIAFMALTGVIGSIVISSSKSD